MVLSLGKKLHSWLYICKILMTLFMKTSPTECETEVEVVKALNIGWFTFGKFCRFFQLIVVYMRFFTNVSESPEELYNHVSKIIAFLTVIRSEITKTMIKSPNVWIISIGYIYIFYSLQFSSSCYSSCSNFSKDSLCVWKIFNPDDIYFVNYFHENSMVPISMKFTFI